MVSNMLPTKISRFFRIFNMKDVCIYLAPASTCARMDLKLIFVVQTKIKSSKKGGHQNFLEVTKITGQ